MITDQNGNVIRFTPERALDNFINHYSLYNMKRFVGKRCFPTKNYKPEAPSLNVMDIAFGENTSLKWLEKNIEILDAIAGTKVKMNTLQVTATALTLYSKFTEYRLNVREILLFLFKFMSGDYGTFYGAVDPMKIGEAATQFLAWRRGEIENLEKEEDKMDAARRHEEMMRDAAPKEFVEKHLKENNSPLLRVIAKANNWEVQPPEESEDEKIYNTAKSILGVEKMEKLFLEKYNCTPQEYIEKYEKGMDTEHPI